jgi:flagellar biosynthetic protein FliR
MLVSVAQAQLFILAITRILAIIIQIPVLGGQLIPDRVKIGLGIILAIIMIPWQPLSVDAVAIPVFAYVIAVLRELIIGVLAGYAANLTFSVFQMTGELFSISSGFGSAKVFNPAVGEAGSALDQLFIMTTLLIFLLINGHHSVIQAIQGTFNVLPLNNPLPDFSVERLLKITVQMIVTGVQLAMPIFGALLLTDLALGLLARVSPQVQVFFLGLPVKIAIGLVALALSLTIMIPTVRQLYYDLGPRMLQLLGV